MPKQLQITSAEYRRLYVKNKLVLSTKNKLLGRPNTKENPVKDMCIVTTNGLKEVMRCSITLVGLFPGINGSNGLKREHWTKYRDRKLALGWRLRIMDIPKFLEKVQIKLIFYHSILADEDSLTSRFKIIGDCLVDMGVLIDDSPKYVTIEKPIQIKSRRKEQKMIIEITKL